MENVKAKAKEISNEKESMQKFQDASLLREKELKKEVSDLTDEGVSTYGVYFKCAKEQTFFLYPNMDLSHVEFLKVVHGNKLVGEKVVVSLELENPTSPRIIQAMVR